MRRYEQIKGKRYDKGYCNKFDVQRLNPDAYKRIVTDFSLIDLYLSFLRRCVDGKLQYCWHLAFQ